MWACERVGARVRVANAACGACEYCMRTCMRARVRTCVRACVCEVKRGDVPTPVVVADVGTIEANRLQLRLECSNDCISGSVGHHQCYINWSSAPYPSYIQTFKRIR